MDGAKKLTGLELDNYQYPLADVSHLSEVCLIHFLAERAIL